MDKKENGVSVTSRRTLLRLATLAGGTGMLSTGVGASDSGTVSRPDRSVLGDFESTRDGWHTNGGNELTRVTTDEFPAGVTSGEYGLVVEITGDAYPAIENKTRVQAADFLANPYLRMDVLAVAEGTTSDLVFQFRLHHTAKATGGAKGGGDSQGKSVLVEESDKKTVAQLRPQTVQWDMTHLSDEVLRTAKRLEIVWYLAEHEPTGGHRGTSKNDFEYQGLVVFDDIRLDNTLPLNPSARRQQKKRELHRSHGMILTRNFIERREDFERGTLVFADGTEVPYSFEVVGDDRFVYTLDGERFEIGGGWT